MQVKETLNEGLKRGYAITVTAAELDAKVIEKLKEAQPDVEMKGFRKGKVPMAMMRKQFGPRVLGEAMQEAIDGAMQEHMEKSGDRPATQPEMKMTNPDWKEGEDVAVDVSYERLPDVPEVDFKAIKLDRMKVEADEESVKEALDNLAASPQAVTFEEKKGAAKDGDQVVFDFVGKVDGEAFEGGTAEDYPLVLGSNSFIPGFEDGLFSAWRNDPEFVLNKAEYKAGTILVAGVDFGTGSSREHAVWALQNYGFKAVISSRFADIFRGNSLKGGLLTVIIEQSDVEALWAAIEANPATSVSVDLETRTVSYDSVVLPFAIDDYTRWRLMEGLDDIGLTFKNADSIDSFEKSRTSLKPATLPIRS